MAMTIEQEREAFEKWMSEAHPSYPLTSHEGRYVLTSVRNLWAAFSSGCAHLTQPAQAVDVGAADRGPWKVYGSGSSLSIGSDDFRHDAQLVLSGDFADDGERLSYAQWVAETLTRALSVQKAGPVGDGWQPIETAPNNGTVVLLAIERPGYSGMTLAYQRDGQWYSEETDAAFGGWTHWHPLPASTPDKEGA